jgi:hypothetical protein
MYYEDKYEREAREKKAIKIWPDGTDEFDHARLPESPREWTEVEQLARTNEAALRRWIFGKDSMIAPRFPEKLCYITTEIAVLRCHELVEIIKEKRLKRLARKVVVPN